jgi:hypothetical protein
MTVAMLIDSPDGSQQLYEKLRAALQLDRPAGGMVHVAGPSPRGGWRVIELWESVEEASRFLQDRFLPVLEAAGFAGRPLQPEFWPVHHHMTCTSARQDTPEIGGRS